MIQHTVVFRLKHPSDSPAERDFLRGAMKLAEIPGVQSLQCLRQVSPKNAFTFGLSMNFRDQAAYSSYNDHPDHVRFVEERWKKEVDDFLEIDYTPYLPGAEG